MIIKDAYGDVDPKSIREDHYQRRRMLRMGMDVTSRIVGGAVAIKLILVAARDFFKFPQ